MPIIINDNQNPLAPKILDDRYGPYTGLTQANNAILPVYRVVGLTVGILEGDQTFDSGRYTTSSSGITEYWYYTGITDSDLVLKTSGSGGGNFNGLMFNLPVPNLKISNESINLETFKTEDNSISNSGVTLVNSPVIVSTDLTIEQINQGVWIEMLIYRKSKRKKFTSKSKKGMVVPTSWKWDSFALSGTNTLEDQILSICPNCKLDTRGGKTKFFSEPNIVEDLKISRPNHYKITGNTESVNLGYFLNGRFTYKNTEYRPPNQSGHTEQIFLPIPVSRRNNNISPSTRFCYKSEVSPTYIKFRYIMFNKDVNGGKGGFITGPTTNTVKIMLEQFPYVPNEPFFSIIKNKYLPTCSVKNGNYNKLKCSIETNVP
jgi:hypothetical protein